MRRVALQATPAEFDPPSVHGSSPNGRRQERVESLYVRVYGPYLYQHRGKWRRLVNLVDDNGGRRTQSYARFLLEQHLGHPLADDEDADHMDGDTLNDDLSNLRVLPATVNRGRDHLPAEMYEFDCPVCGIRTAKPARRVRDARRQGKAGPFCGRQCSRAWQVASLPPTRGASAADGIVPTCPTGHVKDGWRTEANGRRYRYCKTCKRERAAKYR